MYFITDFILECFLALVSFVGIIITSYMIKKKKAKKGYIIFLIVSL